MRRLLAPAAALAAAATLAACGGGGGGGTTATTASPATTASTPTTATATTPAPKAKAKRRAAHPRRATPHTDTTSTTATTAAPSSGSGDLASYRSALGKACRRFTKQAAALNGASVKSAGSRTQLVQRLRRLGKLGRAEVKALRAVPPPAGVPGRYAHAIGLLDTAYGKLGAVARAAANPTKDPHALVRALQAFAKPAAKAAKAFAGLKLPECGAAGTAATG